MLALACETNVYDDIQVEQMFHHSILHHKMFLCLLHISEQTLSVSDCWAHGSVGNNENPERSIPLLCDNA